MYNGLHAVFVLNCDFCTKTLCKEAVSQYIRTFCVYFKLGLRKKDTEPVRGTKMSFPSDSGLIFSRVSPEF